MTPAELVEALHIGTPIADELPMLTRDEGLVDAVGG
jgi:hypothetical protein